MVVIEALSQDRIIVRHDIDFGGSFQENGQNPSPPGLPSPPWIPPPPGIPLSGAPGGLSVFFGGIQMVEGCTGCFGSPPEVANQRTGNHFHGWFNLDVENGPTNHQIAYSLPDRPVVVTRHTHASEAACLAAAPDGLGCAGGVESATTVVSIVLTLTSPFRLRASALGLGIRDFYSADGHPIPAAGTFGPAIANTLVPTAIIVIGTGGSAYLYRHPD